MFSKFLLLNNNYIFFSKILLSINDIIIEKK